MALDLNSVMQYVVGKKQITFPQMQSDLHLSYCDALKAIDKLLEQNAIAFKSGITYDVRVKEETPAGKNSMREKYTYTDAHGHKRFDLKACLRQMKEDEEDAEPSDLDDDEKPELDWDYYNAVKFAVYNEEIDGRMLSVRLNVSYLKAMRILHWMADMGFTVICSGMGMRKTLISADDIDFQGRDEAKDKSSAEQFGNSENAFRRFQILHRRESVADEPDTQYYEALKIAVRMGVVHGLMLMRLLNTSFSKVDKILTWMENMGYVEKGEGFSRRKVLIGKEELANILQNVEGVDVDEDDASDEGDASDDFVGDYADVDYDDDEDEDEDEESDENYFERLKKKLDEIAGDDDDDDDDDEIDEVQTKSDYIPVDIASLNTDKDMYGTEDSDADFFVKRLGSLFYWERKDGGAIIINARGLKYKTGEDVKFRLVRHRMTTWVLSDNKFVKYVLTKVRNLSGSDADAKIERLLSGSRIVFACDELRIRTNPIEALADLTYLYGVVQSLI